jgi:outer membrane protein TolC
MRLDSSHEEFLRNDVATAAKALDAARDLLSSDQVTAAEAQMNYRAAFVRYAAALRRFSDLVVGGRVPNG